MRDHWWWRPGWGVGRRFYTWHITFPEQTDVQRFASNYRSALSEVGGLDLIPDQWLHLTTQGVGFVEDVTREEVDAIVEAARQRLALLQRFELTFPQPSIDQEALLVPVQPPEPVHQVRNAIRQGIAEVLTEVPEREEGFTPHVSLAYSNSDRPAAGIAQKLNSIDIPPATALISSVQLIVIHRDNKMYEWQTCADVKLGT